MSKFDKIYYSVPTYINTSIMASSAWPSTWQEFIALLQEERIAATPSQLNALKLLFSDQSVPVSEVAKLITVDSVKAHEETPGASDSGLWRTLSDGIKQLTEYNDKFVEFFYEIAKVPLHGATSTLLTAYWEWWTEWAFSCKFILLHENKCILRALISGIHKDDNSVLCYSRRSTISRPKTRGRSARLAQHQRIQR